jgi:hypothetical protein
MAYGVTLHEKKNLAYVWFANAVASESAATPDHEKRLALAKQMANGGGSLDWYVTIDFAGQGFTDATALGDVQNRLSGLASNLVALGFGG